MKVLNIVFAKVWGGGEQYVYDTSKALVKQGVEVHIAVDSSCQDMLERFSKVAKAASFNLHSLAGFKSLKNLIAYIKRESIDIINCHSGHAMALCLALKKMTKVKLVCFKHNALPAKLDAYHNWQRRHTDAFICVSKLVYDLQTKGLGSEETQKFHLVYNGIDTERYDQLLQEKAIVKNKDFFTIGYAGRLARDKGIDVLLEAVAVLTHKYNHIRVFIAGNDEKGYKEHLTTLINDKKLQEKVQFIGHLDNMANYYRSLDVFVLPSVVREAFGLTICEAMYCGVPVITTDSGAQREIISNNNLGKIVEAGNITCLAKAVECIINKPIDIENMIELAQERVKLIFTVDKCAKMILSIYIDILGS